MTLLKSIAAFQIDADDAGKQRCGLISQLPKGAQLNVCGTGLIARTAKIECDGRFYFAFVKIWKSPSDWRARKPEL